MVCELCISDCHLYCAQVISSLTGEIKEVFLAIN